MYLCNGINCQLYPNRVPCHKGFIDELLLLDVTSRTFNSSFLKVVGLEDKYVILFFSTAIAKRLRYFLLNIEIGFGVNGCYAIL